MKPANGMESTWCVRTWLPLSAWTRKVAILVLIAIGSLTIGCREKAKPPRKTSLAMNALRKEQSDQDVFEHAWSTLNHIEELDAPDIQFAQAIDRIDHWVKGQKPPPGWQRDPMLDSLGEDFLKLPSIKQLDSLKFTMGTPNYDAESIRTVIWFHNISEWARGEKIEGISRAICLFDWTVRNIQLEDELDDAEQFFQKPSETLLLGRGTATDRVWVFILLARQQGLDAAVLGVSDPNDPNQEDIWPWLVAVREDKELYLFDPSLGIPIPGPDGIRLDDDGQLEITPATLAQVVENDSLLTQLDLDDEQPYPITSQQAANVTVLIEASPAYLTQRMKLIENHLSGDDQCVLTTNPTAQAKRFMKCRHVRKTQLWEMPKKTLLQEQALGDKRKKQLLMPMFTLRSPTLQKGRIYHFMGHFSATPSAMDFYQMSRIPNSKLHQANVSEEEKAMAFRVKLDASYWLGLIAFEQGNAGSAIDYFKVRTLEFLPNGPWVTGGVYNLGRAYELDGSPRKAIQVYLDDRESPAFHGNLLRARWLESLCDTPPHKPKPNATPNDTPSILPGLIDIEPPADEKKERPDP